MTRNIVICLDGTANEAEGFPSNVIRTFEIASKSDTQIVYYDPGVGTMGARGRSSRIGKLLSRVGGLAFGHGVKENIEEAYRFLMDTYREGDKVFIFGFSRGAYTARALAGLIRSVGLIRPGLENMLPYAMKLYTRKTKEEGSDDAKKAYWKPFNDFRESFGNPDFPHPFDRGTKQVHFLGVWDTVKFVGWFNLKGQFQQARWPFTRNIANVETARHGLALDEKRRFYADYRLTESVVSDEQRDVEELWFVGVHSDVGGGLSDDQPLAKVSLEWMLGEAEACGFELDAKVYRRHLTVKHGEQLAPIGPDVSISRTNPIWAVAGLGWRRRKFREGDTAHSSVASWQETHQDYRPKL